MTTPSREEYQQKLDQYAEKLRSQGHHVDVMPVDEITDPWDESSTVDYIAYMYVDGVKKIVSYDDQIGWYLD